MPSTNRNAGVPAVAYARVSLAREEMISPQIQMDAIKTWAARNGRILVGDPIMEEGVTGRTFDRRIIEAIERVEMGEAAEILVWKFSRFGRNTYETALNVARIEDAGGALVSVTEEVDASTATGGFTRDMLFALANMESRRIGEGWKEAQAIRLKAGLPHTATPRYGYTHHKCSFQTVTKTGWRIVNVKDPVCRPDASGQCHEEYRIHPETGSILRDMYERYADGKDSLQSLAAWLNAEGIASPRGLVWKADTVASTLDSGFGAGLIQVGVGWVKKGKKRTREHAWVPGAHVPVIDAATWDRYRARREERRGDAASTRTKWPLSGITRCGLCGGPMTCTTGGPGGRSGKQRQIRGYILRCTTMQESKACPGLWRVTHEVEAALLDAMDDFADKLAAAAAERRGKMRPPQKAPARDVRMAEKRLAEIRVERSRVVQSIAKGTLTDEMAAETLAGLASEETRLKGRVAEAEEPVKVWTAPEIRTFRQDWQRLDLATQRSIVRKFADRIVVLPKVTEGEYRRHRTVKVYLSDEMRATLEALRSGVTAATA